ncbi:putative membrane protein [Clostridium argentinense CDC 2741]|uniref:Putative membrane protein n=1 Tax=Clostridium argentinense CDC 2741 TaxID=1418104 RepID=A0A0C1QXX5_9CLOT|nr:hypothetical protein [Clostridium argentinense]ARC83347.1 hypothetical protein RSJ17_01675 [Clostridium argentinense]KIE45857.1 putative membrane protein [Clostridium argentinense CDC 2741]
MKSNYKSIIIVMFKVLCLILFSKIILYSIQFGSLSLSITHHIILAIFLIPSLLLVIKNKNWFLIILFIEGILFIGISLFKLVNI